MRLVFMSILVAILMIPTSTLADSSRSAAAMAADLHGNLFIARGVKVLRVSPDGEETLIGTTPGIARSLALASHGDVYVLDRTGTVYRFERDGRRTAVGTGYDKATAIAVDRDGAVMIAGEGGSVVPLDR